MPEPAGVEAENPPPNLSVFSLVAFHVIVNGELTKKQQTYEQVDAKKDKAAQFLRDVVGDDDAADDIEDESVADYADHKGIKITNPWRQAMANGNAGNGDYDFDGWTKQDCVDALNQVAQIAYDAYDPMSSREDLAGALADILDALSDGDDGGDEDADDSYSDDDDTR